MTFTETISVMTGEYGASREHYDNTTFPPYNSKANEIIEKKCYYSISL